MAGKQAKILADTDLDLLLCLADQTRNPRRNRIIVLLSIKAGLRAGEIAALTWDMVLDAQGRVGTVIELQDHAAKKRSGRRIPIHSDLRRALIDLLAWSSGIGNVVQSERGGSMTPLS